jgi:hypothetical protein
MNVSADSNPPSCASSALSLGVGIAGDELLNNMPPVQQHVVLMPQRPEYEPMEGSSGHTTPELPAAKSDDEGNLEIDEGAGGAGNNEQVKEKVEEEV